jgi:hypothetical protein
MSLEAGEDVTVCLSGRKLGVRHRHETDRDTRL